MNRMIKISYESYGEQDWTSANRRLHGYKLKALLLIVATFTGSHFLTSLSSCTSQNIGHGAERMTYEVEILG
ncbi:hypothetical protein FIBSPDRAFT_240844 [Athelia psychrophila]|uniref:Uncharacterized protein n=1 Tax=Athelia psychrophila TaxID=1759441 RepID=A0A165YA25_9AGAM|nr:hypothetical protein FIBSPDRAFT_240844 [Fibularhizoctonia sp. CBS 109695]